MFNKTNITNYLIILLIQTIKENKGKSPGIQNLNYSLIDQSQASVKQQEPRNQERQIQYCQGLGNTEFPNKLKKLEKPHVQDIIQLYFLIEKMNTEIQSMKAENQNLKLLFKIKKEDKDQVSQVQFQIEALTSKFIFIVKIQQQINRKLMKKFNYKLKRSQPETDKMEIEQKTIIQQNLYFKPSIKHCYCCQQSGHSGSNVRSENSAWAAPKRIWNLRKLYCNCFGGIYRKKLVLLDSSVTQLKQDFGFQQQQNRQLQKDNDDLRIYLEKLEKNYKKMEEQFYEIIEEKEELSQFEIDSDEDMQS